MKKNPSFQKAGRLGYYLNIPTATFLSIIFLCLIAHSYQHICTFSETKTVTGYTYIKIYYFFRPHLACEHKELQGKGFLSSVGHCRRLSSLGSWPNALRGWFGSFSV